MSFGHYDITHGGKAVAAGDSFDARWGDAVVVSRVLTEWPRKRRATVRTHEAPPPIPYAPFCFMEE